MAFLSILNAWQTASEWSLAIRTDMHWCMFSWDVMIKKRLKLSDLHLGIWLFIQEWTTWPSQHDMTGQHDRRVKFLAGQVTILARHCRLTGHYFEPWIFINQTDLASTSVAAVWQKLCISDWKALNVRGCRRTKLKICGSKYSMFTIFYIVIFMHNKSNSYQCLNNKSSYLQAQFDCFLLMLTYALLVDKGTDDVINVCFCFFVMYYEADRFYVVEHLFRCIFRCYSK